MSDDIPFEDDSAKKEELLIIKYKLYIEYIRHENLLLNQRTTWLVVIQAAFLTVLAGLVAKYIDVNPSNASQILSMPFSVLDDNHRKLFIAFMVFWFLICVLGISICIVSRYSIRAADKAQQTLKLRWEREFRTEAYKAGLPDLMGGGHPRADQHGSSFAKSIPNIMIIVWSALILLEFALIGLKIS